jgi:hypothetical protein
VLNSISIATAPSDTDYNDGQTFDPAGLVLSLNYSAGGSWLINYNANTASFFGFTAGTLSWGTSAVVVTFAGKTVSQAVAVHKGLVSITINGALDPRDGTPLTTTLSPAGATATYQWQRYEWVGGWSGSMQWVNIANNSTSASYTPIVADIGMKLRVIATGTGLNTGGTPSVAGSVTSAPTGDVVTSAGF